MIVQCCQFCVKKIKAPLSLYSEGREYNVSIGQAQFISNYSIMHRSKPHHWPCASSVEWLLSLVASPCLDVPLHIRNANVLKQRIKLKNLNNSIFNFILAPHPLVARSPRRRKL
jgi:hypothetical protein